MVSGQASDPVPHHNPPGFTGVTSQTQYDYRMGLQQVPAQHEGWTTVYSNGPSLTISDSAWDFETQDGSMRSHWDGRPT